jgi:hypothetical protein
MSTFMRATASLVLGILELVACQSAMAQKKSLPPVRYKLQLIPFPATVASGHGTAYGANHAGEVVGSFPALDNVGGVNYSVGHAFAYSPLLEPTAVDLHEKVKDQISALLDNQWFLSTLTKINSSGDAVGSLGKYGVSGNKAKRACVVYGATSTSPELMLLPDQAPPGSPEWNVTWGAAINDAGVIAVGFDTPVGTRGAYVVHPLAPTPDVLPYPLHYRSGIYINNNNSIAVQQETGEVTVYSIGTGSSIVYPQLNFNSREQPLIGGINDSGVLCGSRVVNSASQIWRYDGTLLAVKLNAGGLGSYINSTKDMAHGPTLYHEGTGLLNLSDLIRGTTADVNRWNSAAFRFSAGLTERGDWNGDPTVGQFPGIAGSISGNVSGSWIFLLTPVKP